MKPSQPYQPFLLRLLHNLNGLLVIGAILTAFWTYNTYDGRWGRLPLPLYGAIEGIHGTFGLWVLLLFPAFAYYAFHRGSQRLLQPNSLVQLTQINKPIGWYSLHRLTNTIAVLALTFALFSGKMMDETWLPMGELDHYWYYAHLISWLTLVISIALHVLMSVRVGGAPLLLSIWRWSYRPADSPTHWQKHLQTWWGSVQGRRSQALNLLQNRSQNQLLWWIEMLVWLSLVAAWVLPLFK